jgi:hypothetical protein
MRTKLILVVVAALVLLGVYLAGYLPERSRRLDAENRVVAMQAERDDAQSRLRSAKLLGDVLALEETVKNRNFGTAEQLTTRFFDAVRDETARTGDASLRTALTGIQAKRDAVTAALARTDPSASDVLHDIEVELRRALGYPVS